MFLNVRGFYLLTRMPWHNFQALYLLWRRRLVHEPRDPETLKSLFRCYLPTFATPRVSISQALCLFLPLPSPSKTDVEFEGARFAIYSNSPNLGREKWGKRAGWGKERLGAYWSTPGSASKRSTSVPSQSRWGLTRDTKGRRQMLSPTLADMTGSLNKGIRGLHR